MPTYTISNQTFNGSQTFVCQPGYDTILYDTCTFNNTNLYADYVTLNCGASNFTFNNCVFNNFGLNGDANNVVITGCDFNLDANWNGSSNDCAFNASTLTVDGNTFINVASSGYSTFYFTFSTANPYMLSANIINNSFDGDFVFNNVAFGQPVNDVYISNNIFNNNNPTGGYPNEILAVNSISFEDNQYNDGDYSALANFLTFSMDAAGGNIVLNNNVFEVLGSNSAIEFQSGIGALATLDVVGNTIKNCEAKLYNVALVPAPILETVNDNIKLYDGQTYNSTLQPTNCISIEEIVVQNCTFDDGLMGNAIDPQCSLKITIKDSDFNNTTILNSIFNLTDVIIQNNTGDCTNIITTANTINNLTVNGNVLGSGASVNLSTATNVNLNNNTLTSCRGITLGYSDNIIINNNIIDIIPGFIGVSCYNINNYTVSNNYIQGNSSQDAIESYNSNNVFIYKNNVYGTWSRSDLRMEGNNKTVLVNSNKFFADTVYPAIFAEVLSSTTYYTFVNNQIINYSLSDHVIEIYDNSDLAVAGTVNFYFNTIIAKTGGTAYNFKFDYIESNITINTVGNLLVNDSTNYYNTATAFNGTLNTDDVTTTHANACFVNPNAPYNLHLTCFTHVDTYAVIPAEADVDYDGVTRLANVPIGAGALFNLPVYVQPRIDGFILIDTGATTVIAPASTPQTGNPFPFADIRDVEVANLNGDTAQIVYGFNNIDPLSLPHLNNHLIPFGKGQKWLLKNNQYPITYISSSNDILSQVGGVNSYINIKSYVGYASGLGGDVNQLTNLPA